MSSLLLLATPFLIQARMPLALLATWAHCWLMSSCCPPVPPRSLSSWALSSHAFPTLTLQGVIVAKLDKVLWRAEKMNRHWRSCPSSGTDYETKSFQPGERILLETLTISTSGKDIKELQLGSL
ncbi:hypothetical protein DUI87_03813 [Hirundo rustica rustica]|uniref:Secreted protein n=1 Tax=Hirundo rustica rustica TaxID=333673 RepID=A0A3M0L172_HIRRU|nr:hypothetical protein DUI87_03813 [Hirundo rustica rustica]